MTIESYVRPLFCTALCWQPWGLAQAHITPINPVGCLMPVHCHVSWLLTCMNRAPRICLQGALALCHLAQTCCVWQQRGYNTWYHNFQITFLIINAEHFWRQNKTFAPRIFTDNVHKEFSLTKHSDSLPFPSCLLKCSEEILDTFLQAMGLSWQLYQRLLMFWPAGSQETQLPAIISVPV